MSGWPQVAVAVWLTVATLGGAARAALTPNKMLVMTRQQQRLSGALFAAAAIGEAALLYQGRFFG